MNKRGAPSQVRPVRPIDQAQRQRLKAAGLRPTRQRLALAQALFGPEARHVTAEQLHGEARAAGAHISLATVYNTLHQFTAAGLLREVLVEPGRVYFDTNTGPHHHFYHEDSGDIVDIADSDVMFARLPRVPAGQEIAAVDVVIRVRRNRAGDNRP